MNLVRHVAVESEDIVEPEPHAATIIAFAVSVVLASSAVPEPERNLECGVDVALREQRVGARRERRCCRSGTRSIWRLHRGDERGASQLAASGDSISFRPFSHCALASRLMAVGASTVWVGSHLNVGSYTPRRRHVVIAAAGAALLPPLPPTPPKVLGRHAG